MYEAGPMNYPSYTETIKCRLCGSMLGGLKLVDGDQFEHSETSRCFAKKQAQWEEQYLRRIGMRRKEKKSRLRDS